jgi:hypothetical protein
MHTRTFRYSFLLTLLLAATLSLLCGCGMGVKAPASGVQGAALQGRVHGGQQPITGASIYLFAASTSGYGNSAINPSLLNTSDLGVLTDSSNNGYVVTGAGGTFNITGDWSCVNPDDQIYIVALGGNPGLTAGTNNPGIALMAALGECDNLVGNYPFINIDEITTVASVWALQQFIGSNGVGFIGTTSTNTAGLANAFLQVPNMVNIGAGTALATTTGGNGTIPQTEINTLADILAYCINSGNTTNPTTNCNTLFADATPSTTPATTPPTDTVQAALMIAQNPTNNVSTLLGLTSSQSPFSPKIAIASPPNDWSIAIQYTGAGISSPQGIAIDALGNVWVTDGNPVSGNYYISRVTPTGADATAGGGYTNPTIIHPSYIAFDTTGNLWIASASCNTIPGGFNSICVTEMDNNGNDQTSGNGIYASAVEQIGGIGPDGSGNMWFTAGPGGNNGLYEFSGGNFTNYASPSFSSANGLSNPNGVAVDHNGRIWVADEGTDPSTLSGNMDIFNGLSENGPITVTGMDGPVQVALDANGYAWFANATGGPDSHTPTISVTDSNGTDLTTTAYGGAGGGGLHSGFSFGGQIAIDGLDNAWVLDFDSSATAPQNTYRMVDLSGWNSAVLGTPLTGTSGLQSSYLNAPQGFAIDPSGNIWISNQAASSGVDSVVEFLGIAGPVMTPQAVQIQGGLIGQEP